MTIKVAIAGASGYAGGEILRLLLNHPAYLAGELEIGALTASSTVGSTLGELMPHLPQLADRVIEDTTPEVLSGHDVVFLGLPHGFSAEIALQLGHDVTVIDCAADFRLQNAADWERYYGSEHQGTWPYGIPEMPGHREQLKGAKRIAVPGCFPTGATLALLPAVQAGLIEPNVSVVSITGVSGAGKKANVAMLGAETMGSLKAYNVAGKHRHTPEIAQNLAEVTAEKVTVSFTPVLAPLPRGILTTATAPLKGEVTAEQARKVYEDFYAQETFVHVLAPGVQPQTQSVVGSNMCHVQVEVDADSGKLLLTSVIDNLTKGTAGAAIQCMNLSLGYAESAGLPQAGVAP
ncbi:N-acetyl-gamma-glutamyl-phosphate reductase [Corynebacterium callunae]|uniref:N-acetyl-gamma-glutamyl-phosphate reductase n=1 Tax=Corynebacterium callunae DSM 20147 TaxID=1121353 RepID=M1UU00_9CORY|nr:N-acetyl-gamma-glutamyl-phosphate reductase [Corynebacterium callunae]AGG66732.1 N-acetyl-gamma-glutamyl-phosphate reductase [Corynebacterium callunae DSM 20147]